MDVITLRSAITVLIFAVFIGIVIWAWSRRNKARFDAAAKLPFADEELHQASKLGVSARNNEQEQKQKV
jgi:cytochrome c oxidase cbb3-type subunit IV